MFHNSIRYFFTKNISYIQFTCQQVLYLLRFSSHLIFQSLAKIIVDRKYRVRTYCLYFASVFIERVRRRCLWGDGLPRWSNMAMTTGGQITRQNCWGSDTTDSFQTNILLHFKQAKHPTFALCRYTVCFIISSKNFTSSDERNS